MGVQDFIKFMLERGGSQQWEIKATAAYSVYVKSFKEAEQGDEDQDEEGEGMVTRRARGKKRGRESLRKPMPKGEWVAEWIQKYRKEEEEWVFVSRRPGEIINWIEKRRVRLSLDPCTFSYFPFLQDTFIPPFCH